MPILECLCNTFGSEDTNCSNDEGVCTCKEGYTGDKCDSCAEGYFQVNNDCISKLMFVYIYKVIILLFSLFLIKSFSFCQRAVRLIILLLEVVIFWSVENTICKIPGKNVKYHVNM